LKRNRSTPAKSPANGDLIINEDEARAVRRIFSSYITGKGKQKIADELSGQHIFKRDGKTNWSVSTIDYILKNEKYIGDALLQKNHIADFHTKKSKKNNGELPQYYVTGNHEAIISKEIFNRVQEETARRNNKRKVSEKNAKTEHSKYSSKYALTELLMCGRCGTQYRRVTWARNGNKKIVWRCINRLEYGIRYCKDSPTIEEYRLQDAIMKAISLLVTDKDELVAILKDSLHIALRGKDDEIDTFAIESRIKELNTVMLDLVQISAKSSASVDYFDDKFKVISDEIKKLQEILKNHEQQQTIAQNTNSRIAEIFQILENESFNLTKYDETLVRHLIDSVKVLQLSRLRNNYNIFILSLLRLQNTKIQGENGSSMNTSLTSMASPSMDFRISVLPQAR